MVIWRFQNTLWLSLLLTSLVGCREVEVEQAEAPRPVTALALQEMDPSADLRLTGAVKAWNEEDIAFEVSGRVTYIAQAGSYLDGHWVENGEVIQQGDVLATLDDEQYRASRDSAQALLEVAATQREVNGRSLERFTDAGEGVSKLELDVTKAEFDAAVAQEKNANASLERAKLDLANTVLLAPFEAQVSEVFVRAGGYARAGEPVAHLVMMDPVKIDVTVSAESYGQVAENDSVLLFLDGKRYPHPAAVYQKATIADPATRTFTVTVITRNVRVTRSEVEGADLDRLPGIRGLMPLGREDPQATEGPVFVEEDQSLYRAEDGQSYIWVLADMGSYDSGLDLSRRSFRIRRVPVEVGDERFNMQGIYRFREVTDAGGVPLNTPVALGLPDELEGKEEAEVVLRTSDWAMRPGGLVDVQLLRDQLTPGFYLPLRAIVPEVGEPSRGYVFVVEPTDDGRSRARKLEVTLHESASEWQRVSAEELSEGARVVVEGAAYLSEGEAVTIVQEVALPARKS